MLDAPGCRIQDVDTRIAGSDPNPTARVHHHGPRGVAAEGIGMGGIMAEDREGISAAVPAGDTGILDRYPEIVMRILDDLVDEVTGQSTTYAGRVCVANHVMAVIADQTVFGTEPDEA